MIGIGSDQAEDRRSDRGVDSGDASVECFVMARTFGAVLDKTPFFGGLLRNLANVFRISVSALFLYRNVRALRMLCAGAELTSGL